jgi:hypothetical protein
MIIVFKNESNAREVRVKLPNYPAGNFRLHSVVTGDSIGTFSGRQFRSGMTLPTPPENKVQIVEVRKA